ncbi:BTB/POZ domain protein [Metarhizium robertsii]|uniref:BTB/POZ domain protein n=1 Tax=Metarhizium robertsii TaxID=568076 RepID=A0A014P3C9_9HYPO|nr:BTB/POZ domain protein [Metarhizium robertsii]
MASSQISRTDRKEVYLSRQVRSIFIQPRYAHQSTSSPVWIYSTDRLVQILRSLLEDHIFESRIFAQEAFPELFPSTKPSDAAPSNPISKPLASTRATPVRADDISIQPSHFIALISEASALATGDYSDLIISGGKHYHVHKVIVCSRSEALATLCKLKSPQANVTSPDPCDVTLDLAPHDPRAVDCMIQYFYHLDYQPPHSNFPLDKEETEEEIIPTAKPSDILLHTRVFILAETYAIDGLKSSALCKLEAAVQEITDVDDFLVATHEAYTQAPDFETRLRHVLVAAFCKHHSKLLASSKTKDLMSSNGSLGFDIYQYSHRDNLFGFRVSPHYARLLWHKNLQRPTQFASISSSSGQQLYPLLSVTAEALCPSHRIPTLGEPGVQLRPGQCAAHSPYLIPNGFSTDAALIGHWSYVACRPRPKICSSPMLMPPNLEEEVAWKDVVETCARVLDFTRKHEKSVCSK